ncbi:MAG: amino acid permease [Mesonia hippocampi]|uniref:amino acid permease n=1 Tax=Mesonia hippocampi TaxID=1628250 RepID=UPI003F9DE657
MSTKNKNIGVMAIAMMTVAAVVSLRGLPMMAKEGTTMFFYIGFCAILFLLPGSLVAAELGSAFSKENGGIYSWVKGAFGSKWGFVAIWLQWIQNVVWYPTVLAFAAASLAYLFGRVELASDGTYTAIVILVIYWLATFMTFRGVNTVAKLTNWFLILGTIVPGVIAILLALFWIIQGNPIEFLSEAANTANGVTFQHPRFFPHISNLSNISFLAGIILLFAGVEVQAVHAKELKNPAKQFPKAMFIAMGIIFLLFTLGSLAIATVIPAEEISLTSGLMQGFEDMLSKFGLESIVPLMGLLLSFGAIGGVMAWIGGPSKGLLETAKEGMLPPILAKTNKNGVQTSILFVQAAIVTILAFMYLLFKDVSVAFFVLSAMTSTLYLVMYMLMYAAAIKLRYSQPDLERSYKVPGGKTGIWSIAGIGLLAVVFAFIVGFVPPSQLPVGSPILYVTLVTAGLVIFVSAPLIINKFKKPSWKKDEV